MGESIDEHDPAYLFGQVITRLDNHEQLTKSIIGKQDETTQALHVIERSVLLLPCRETLAKLKALEGQLKAQEEARETAKKELTKQKITLQQGIILILISSVMATVMTLITNSLAVAIGSK